MGGITLIALVITIIVLLILAAISIAMLTGENGLLTRASDAKKQTEIAEAKEQARLDIAAWRAERLEKNESTELAIDKIKEILTGKKYVEEGSIGNTSFKTAKNGYEILYSELDKTTTGGSSESLDVNKLPKGPNGNTLVSGVTITKHDTIIGEDDKGNQVVIPGGFKIADDSGTNVQDGIVIEDASGNQFVWVPVSNINHDGSNKIKLKDNSEVEITLGRYTFDSETGEETKVQYGSEYAKTSSETLMLEESKSYGIQFDSYHRYDFYYELNGFRESIQEDNHSGTNSTAKDLEGFINSVSTNKGYYIARYEASYASGNAFGVGDDASYYKPASKVSTAINQDPSGGIMNYTPGTLWNGITQGNASKASRQMYYGNSYIESDLINSYAWDTAIVYIQAMGYSNYANQKDGNGTLKNTGETGEHKCKIFDMAANMREWTTEYCTYAVTINNVPCTSRGAIFNDDRFYSSSRAAQSAIPYGYNYSFRVILYCKI